MPNLLSATILHRHGARGPGASELTPWDNDNEIATIWQEHQRENLSSAGKAQGVMLGTWFAKKYYLSNIIIGGANNVHWRCSKSDRGKESGFDFVKGFNEVIGKEARAPCPEPYDVDADNYFRPWKIYKDKADAVKNKMTTPMWIEKANENEAFLVDVLTRVGAKQSLIEKLPKALWACTYLYAIQEVEEYWPQEEGIRKSLTCKLTVEDSNKIDELALWVWEQRFLHSGVQVPMGGRICSEMFQAALNLNNSLNIFSGHDYTILGVISVLNLLNNFPKPMSYGCYVLFELWDSSFQSDEPGPVVRVIINPNPFKNMQNESVAEVCDLHEIVIGEITLRQIHDFISSCDSCLKTLPLKGLEAKKVSIAEEPIDMLS